VCVPKISFKGKRKLNPRFNEKGSIKSMIGAPS
jgi:hypothetical protein